jgi:predicted GNAT superfamily acetyltransferase
MIGLKVLETNEELVAIEDLQRLVWPGNETDVVPSHILLTAVHNGGLMIGAYEIDGNEANQDEPVEMDFDKAGRTEIHPDSPLVGFVFGFPGLDFTPDGPRLKHCSHMLGVHPGYRNRNIGFTLKRAQWQWVRHQGLDRITWTYDPLLSRNANLNIALLGAVCNTYLPEYYGRMRDNLNAGLPSDRFQVDWWLNTSRVGNRLSKKPRLRLDLAHFLEAGTEILNPSHLNEKGLPVPATMQSALAGVEGRSIENPDQSLLLLIEIPTDIGAIKAADPGLALEWRIHTRKLFEDLFAEGYLATDFVYLPGKYPRSFYVLSNGERTL